MKIMIFAGGNKTLFSGDLARGTVEVLCHAGYEAVLMAAKGKMSYCNVPVCEVSPSVTAKTLTSHLMKNKVGGVISFMNLTVCRAAVAARIPFVYVEPEDFKEDSPVKDKKTLLKQAKKVFVLTDSLSSANKKKYTGLKIQTISAPAVYAARGGERPACFKRANNVIAYAPFTKEGGASGLVKMWAELSPKHPTWHLSIAGDGSGKTALNKLIAKHHLEHSTQLVPSAQYRSLLGQADIFAFPAENPACVGSLLAAMASKLPCAAFKTEKTSVFIESGLNGVLAQTPSAFVQALDKLMVDWGYRVGLAVQAEKIKDKYPLEVFVKTLAEALL